MPIDRIRDSEELSEFSSYFEKTYIGYFKKQTQKVLRLLYKHKITYQILSCISNVK